MSKLKYEATSLKDVKLIHMNVFEDERGFFMESYSEKDLQEIGIFENFVQENHVFNKQKHTFRGMHFQTGEYAQARLTRVISGSIIITLVDIRKDSPTYGQVESFTLSAENKDQLYIPIGFANGMLTLEENSTLLFKCSAYYNKEEFYGINPIDEQMNYPYKKDKDSMVISQQDLEWPTFKEFEKDNNFQYKERSK